MPDYGPLYQAAGTQWNVDPLLLQTLGEIESAEGRNVGPSSAGARGFLQFMPGTAEKYGVDVNDPTSSIYGGANYIADLLAKHGGNVRKALAEYGGVKSGDPNHAYPNAVMQRYTQLSNAWAGGAGQPATVEAPTPVPEIQGVGRPPTGIAAGPAGSPLSPEEIARLSKTGPVPGWVRGGAPAQSAKALAAPEVPVTFAPHDEEGRPAGGSPGTTAPEAGVTFAPHDEEGRPIQGGVAPQGQPGQQYLSSATSPGALATGKPIAEDQVPGPGFQAAIKIPTDPEQRARVAADQLGVPLDRIIFGPNGRMAVADETGQAHYIEPAKVTSYYEPQTRGEPGTPWHGAGPFAVNPYSAASPLAPESARSYEPGNLLRAGGAMLPGAVANALTMGAGIGGEALGGPVGGSAATGLATGITDMGRQFIANALDPNREKTLPVASWDTAKDAAANALLYGGFSAANKLFEPLPGMLFGRAPEPVDRIGRGGQALPITRQQPYGNRDILAPWEPPQRWELPPNQPPGTEPPPPSSPVPGAAPPRPGVGPLDIDLNPMGEAAEARGPYAPNTAQEIAAIPKTPPPQTRMPITTQKAADARADEIIRYYAAGGNTAADTRNLVPGSAPTLTGITGNAGLASLERTIRNSPLPGVANRFSAAQAAEDTARKNFVGELIGTPAELERATAARDAATSRAREAAFATTTPTDASAAVGELDRVLAGPEGKRSGVAEPLRRLREAFFTKDAEGKPALETDPAILYGVRKNITDSLSPLARGTERDARAAAAQLRPVLDKLDAAIEAGAPGYRGYMQQFNQMSQPINAMEYLQGRNLTDAAGNPLLRPIDTLLKDIQRQRTLQPGVRPADALSQEQITQLEALRDHLRQQANLGKGKALGSNTVQNLAASSLGNVLMRPAAKAVGVATGGLLGHWLGEGMLGGVVGASAAGSVENRLLSRFAKGEDMVREAVIDRLLNKDNLGVRALQGGQRSAP